MTQPTSFTQEQLAWRLPRLHNGSAVPQLAASLAVPSLAVPSLGGQSWGGGGGGGGGGVSFSGG